MVLVTFLGTILLAGGVAAYYGWAMSIRWGWFLVPLGLPMIGIAHAIGINTMVSMYTAALKKNDSDDDVSQFVTIAVIPIFMLIFGWVAKQFM